VIEFVFDLLGFENKGCLMARLARLERATYGLEV
jgi:hypothetical protein